MEPVTEETVRTPTTFINRLLAEKSDLDDKIGKLKNFLESEPFKNIDNVQSPLLRVQAHATMTYSQILFERIELLKK